MSVPSGAGVVVPYPSVPAVGEVVWRDEAGEVAGTLMRWGVRHQLQRWIPRSTLLGLWREVRGYRPPAGTRACGEGGRVWLDEVIDRVEAQQGWQRRRRDTYIACAAAYAGSCLAGHPPLTTATQEQVAALIGKCDRHVRRVLEWLEQQGLLGQVLRGTRTKKVDVPAGETDQERDARLAAEAAELAARRERIAAAKTRRRASLDHARAELDAVRAGAPVPLAPDGFEEFRRPAKSVDRPTDEDEAARVAAVLVLRLASVYELRVPADPEPVPPPAPRPVVVDLRAERDRRRPDPRPTEMDPAQGHPDPEPAAAHLSLVPAPTCADTENVLPNGSDKERLSTPDDAGVVDKNHNRGAARRSDDASCPVIDLPGRKQSTDHRSHAQRAAARLLGRTEHPQASSQDRLPQRLTWGVSMAWLAARIRTHVDAGWTDAELVWQLTTRGGRYPFLPVHIHDRRALLTDSLAVADPAIRPQVQAVVAEVEAENRDFAQHQRDRIAWQDNAPRRRELARGRAGQAAIAACGHCDEHGWTLLDGAGPEVRCDHPATPRPGPRTVPDHPGGPAGGAARAAIAAQLAEQRAAREAAAAARDEQRRQLLEQARPEHGRNHHI